VRYELTRGLAYLQIKHPNIGWYTVRWPLLLSLVLCISYWFLPAKPQLIGGAALLGDLLGVIATLPGFYFAALAAVATFDRPGMDVEIPDPAPELEIEMEGQREPIKLTKRMFLSYLFSYLTTLSLALCAYILALNALQPTMAIWSAAVMEWPHYAMAKDIVRVLVLASVVLPISALAVSTLHGIFFLTERIHQTH